MDYFKETETLLYSVPKNEKALRMLEQRKNRLIKQNAPTSGTATDFSKPYSKASFENDTLNQLCELGDVCETIRQTQQKIDEVKACVELIQDTELITILRLWYFKRLPKEAIAEQIDRWSVSTVYNKRNLAVREFARIYWGAKVN